MRMIIRMKTIPNHLLSMKAKKRKCKIKNDQM